MNTKEIREKKIKLKLTKKQREILVGTLLGDAHLETQNKGRTYRLKVEHSVSQKEYLKWMYKEFEDWIPGGIYEKQAKDGRKFIGFNTYSHGAFRFYAKQFYKNGKKVVPKQIHKILKPLSIAVWYMDDGSRKSLAHKTYIIHTYGFKYSDQLRLVEALSKYGIEANLHRQKKNMWRIYILTESSKILRGILVKEFRNLETMQYKIG